MVTLEEILEERCKVFEAHRQAAKEHRKAEEAWELQEFLACFKKERQGKVTQVKEVILPSTSSKAKVMPDVGTSSPSVTHDDVSSMLNDHSKHMTNQLKYMLEDGLVKKIETLSTSSDSYNILDNPQASVLQLHMSH
jgi:predicted HTH transcriptional regulator